MRWTVNLIKETVRATGSHYFDPSTMRFFGTKVLPTVYQGPGGIYFVTSERQHAAELPRRYTVRQFMLPDKIDTVGRLNRFSGAAHANAAAADLAAEPLQVRWYRKISKLDRAVTGGVGITVTMNLTINYLSAEAALAGEIIYFPGDGGYTRVRVRRYGDYSGIYLELVGQGVTERRTAWNETYERQRECCRILRTLDTQSFLPATVSISEPFAPVSQLEQLLHVVAAHTTDPNFERDAARRLMDAATHHHHLMEQLCSDEAFCREIDEDGEHPEILRTRGEIETLAEALGAAGVVCSGDPRGCTVKLTFADGYHDDDANEGYCVPVNDTDEEDD